MAKDKKLQLTKYEQAAEWFEAHDMADFEDHLVPVDFSFDLRRNRDWVELDGEIAKAVRELARRKNIPTRKLVNKLLKERLQNLQ